VQDRLAEEILGGRVMDGMTVQVDVGAEGLTLRPADRQQVDAAA
jgi:hypothetical protein